MALQLIDVTTGQPLTAHGLAVIDRPPGCTVTALSRSEVGQSDPTARIVSARGLLPDLLSAQARGVATFALVDSAWHRVEAHERAEEV